MRVLKAFLAAGLMLGVSGGLAACKSSHDPNVTSNVRSQWTTVNADTKTTTDAATAILTGDDLKKVKGTSTEVDGKATAEKADGTKITVLVKKTGTGVSQVTVTVGTFGDSALGADYAARIKNKAEGH
jgi:hypothetical protein